MKFSNSLFICAVLGLSGCGANHDFSDLQAYMDEVRAKPKGAIEPLPTFQPYESFTYKAASLRSPFQPPIKIDVVARQKGSKEIKPDESQLIFIKKSQVKCNTSLGPDRNWPKPNN